MKGVIRVKDTTVTVGLDSCAQVSLVDYEFARTMKLDQAPFKSPILKDFHNSHSSSRGAFYLPITATDARGVTKSWRAIACAIEGKPEDPVLLGMPAMSPMNIQLDTGSYRWYFGVRSQEIELLTPHQLAKALKQEAIVYALMIWDKDEEADDELNDEIHPPDDPTDTDPNQWESLTNLPTEIQDRIAVFSQRRSRTLPPHKNIDHSIDLIPGTTPPYGPIYPLSRTELQVLQEYIDLNLKLGRIRPSKSPAGAPILFVPKKDGGLRLCVDYRGLNRVSVKNRYPLPLISEILDRLSGATYFSKIDVQDAYYRIRIKEGDEWKTAFRTRYGHFEYTVMPFGLTNAPATFQNYIHIALSGYLDVFCVAYLDDILIFSKDRDSHTKHIRLVLDRMHQYELYAKPSKCTFYQSSVEFLGYIVSGSGVSMDPERVKTIQNWRVPTTFREIQVFLGFCNFYRRFIYNYSNIVRPLTDLTKGSKNGKKPGTVTLDTRAIQAFKNLILAFQTAPILHHFDPNRPIRLETDASQWGMAGILSQQDDDGVWHPVAYWSKKFTPTESRYPTGDQELYAIVHSFRVWRHYLEGSRYRIDVISDHNNLKGFMNTPRLQGRQARWCMTLSPFDFVIRHRAGKKNPADGPSRMMEAGSRDALDATLLNPLATRMATVEVSGQSQAEKATLAGRLDTVEVPEQFQALDATPAARVDTIKVPEQALAEVCYTLADLYKLKTELVKPAKGKPLDRSLDTWRQELGRSQRNYHEKVANLCRSETAYVNSVSVDLKSLIREVQDEDPETVRIRASITAETPGMDHWSLDPKGIVLFKNRFYIPSGEKLKSELLRLHHDDPITGGHFGRARTIETISRKYYWRNVHAEVKEYVKRCPICQGNASPRHRPYGQLVSLPIPDRPWQETSMDFITGLPVTIHEKREVDSILVIVDRFSKFVRFFPVHTTMTASDLAELYHNEIELQYGPQEGIVSDRGSLFTSKFWTRLFDLAGTRLRFSTAFHPQTDGQTERMNQTLEHYLRSFIGEDQVAWPKLLRSAQYCCNHHKNATTTQSPMETLFGYDASFQMRDEADAPKREMPAVEVRLEKLAELRKRLIAHWENANESMAKRYNASHALKTFRRDQLVVLSTRNLRIKTARKLSPKWIGPFKVLKPIGSQAYRIALPEKYSRLHNVFHVNMLEEWHSDKRNDADYMPLPDLEEDDEEYEVEEVKDEHKFDGEIHFLVKWKGWPSEYNEWVPEYDMANARKSIADYRKRTKTKKTVKN